MPITPKQAREAQAVDLSSLIKQQCDLIDRSLIVGKFTVHALPWRERLTRAQRQVIIDAVLKTYRDLGWQVQHREGEHYNRRWSEFEFVEPPATPDDGTFTCQET